MGKQHGEDLLPHSHMYATVCSRLLQLLACCVMWLLTCCWVEYVIAQYLLLVFTLIDLVLKSLNSNLNTTVGIRQRSTLYNQ